MAAAKVPTPRDISPWLQRFRQFLCGREVTLPVRFSKDVYTRDPPEANLPPGASHLPSANYYFTRDARREVQFPKVLADNTKEGATKALQAGEGEAGAESAPVQSGGGKMRTPGGLYKYSQ